MVKAVKKYIEKLNKDMSKKIITEKGIAWLVAVTVTIIIILVIWQEP